MSRAVVLCSFLLHFQRLLAPKRLLWLAGIKSQFLRGKTKQDPQVHWRELSRPARQASRARGLESYLALVSSSLLSSCSWENFSKRAEIASPIGFFQQETWWLGQVRLPPLFSLVLLPWFSLLTTSQEF